MSSSLVRLLSVSLSVVILLGGCSSSLKHYVDLPRMNLQVLPNIDSGGIFSSASANLEIYLIDKNCQEKFLGVKHINDDPVDVGLPVGRQLELVVNFKRSKVLGNSSSSSAMSMYLTPSRGAHYVLKAEYDGKLQDVLLYKKAGKVLRKIEGDSGLRCQTR